MKFATKKDIEAPIAEVWTVMTDFDTWERAAMRRGVEVARTDSLNKPAVGMAWLASFSYRSKDRKVDLKLTELSEPALLGFVGTSSAIEIEARVELIEMSARRTRLHVTMEAKSRSLGARLFLQSLRLARGKVDRKFDQRVGHLAAELEQRSRQSSRRA